MLLWYLNDLNYTLLSYNSSSILFFCFIADALVVDLSVYPINKLVLLFISSIFYGSLRCYLYD
jgi:hypothetical protein